MSVIVKCEQFKTPKFLLPCVAYKDNNMFFWALLDSIS